MREPDIDPGAAQGGFEDPFPYSDAHLRWQAEAEACAAARERELAEILRRVAERTHTRQDVQRLVRELDIGPTLPRADRAPHEPNRTGRNPPNRAERPAFPTPTRTDPRNPT